MFTKVKNLFAQHTTAARLTAASGALTVVSASPVFAADGDMTVTGYLSQVGTVFTWLLSEITELISFIFGNPFLGVSLVLFMCGAVVSFFVRIKNS